MIGKLAVAGLLGGLAGYGYHRFMGSCEGMCPSATSPSVPVVAGVILALLAVGFSKP